MIFITYIPMHTSAWKHSHSISYAVQLQLYPTTSVISCMHIIVITQEISGIASLTLMPGYRCFSHYVANQLNLRHQAHFHEGPRMLNLFNHNHPHMYYYFETESACVVRTHRQTRLNHAIHVTISGLIQWGHQCTLIHIGKH